MGDKKLLGIVCVLVVAGVLISTLWPFNPLARNDVAWLEGANGLRFGNHGVVESRGLLSRNGDGNRSGCSLELLLRPAEVARSGTIVSFYDGVQGGQLKVRQWTDGLLVAHVGRYASLVPVTSPQAGARDQVSVRVQKRDARPGNRSKFDVDHAFHRGRLLLLTVTSGGNGSTVYVDGRRAQVFPHFSITTSDIAGQLVMGTSAMEYEPWSGEIHGLAVYAKELTPEEVAGHFATWNSGNHEAPDLEAAVARYSFTEGGGREVRNDVRAGADLAIPERFRIPHKPILKSPFAEFEANWLYAEDILMNIGGFVPVGFFLCAYAGLGRSHIRAVVWATLAGGLLSLSIELLQALIPRRASGVTDILTNTLGAALGAMLARPRVVGVFLRTVERAFAPRGRP
jgi:hypothetical protein